MGADDLGRREGSRNDVDVQREGAFDDLGHGPGAHHEGGSGVDASGDLVGVEHRADPDRQAGATPSLNGIQRAGRIERDLDRPDPPTHERLHGRLDVSGAPVAHDPQDFGRRVPSGHERPPRPVSDPILDCLDAMRAASVASGD